jgi:hypothetical protein
VTSGQRDRSSPSLSALCDHPHHSCTTPDDVATSRRCWARGDKTLRQRPLCHVRAPVNGTLKPAHYNGQSTNRYAAALEAAPVRAQGAPRRLNRSGIRQDGRQLHNTARHTSTRREIVRYACKLLPPWPINGGAAPPQPRGHGMTDREHSHALHLLHDIGTCLNQHLWDLGARPPHPPRL